MITSINDMVAAYNAVWLGINAYNVSALLRGRAGPASVPTQEELQRFKRSNEGALPMVSVLLPAYHEEAVLRESVSAIERSDYPKESFEVLVLLERGDAGTSAMADGLSKTFSNVIPMVVPQDAKGSAAASGKPRALNYGLARASGSIVGVVDAEDIIGRNLLLESSYMIAERGYDAVQGILDMANDGDGWRNLMQRAEYGYWYNRYLRALAKANYPVPFGGTTNFFKKEVLQKMGGWDQNNLTEDFELGLRLFNSNASVVQAAARNRRIAAQPQYGSIPFKSKVYTAEFYAEHKADYASPSLSEAMDNYTRSRSQEAMALQRDGKNVAMIGSVTAEESPTTAKAWLRQRTRWQQGKIQTMRKNLKNPPKGARPRFHTFLAAMQPHIAALNVTGVALGAYAFLTNSLSEPIKALTDVNLSMLAFYAVMNAAGYLEITRAEKESIPYRRTKALVAAVTLPAYWAMQWAADIRAMKLEYIDKSSVWSKTEHLGRHFHNAAGNLAGGIGAESLLQPASMQPQGKDASEKVQEEKR